MQLFFNYLIQTDFRITASEQEFQSFEGAKLNYSSKKFSDEIFLPAHGLLFEEGIKAQNISIGEFRHVKTLFAHDAAGDLPFDPFAAAFYLVTRYEEYFPFSADRYKRFPDKESINFREGFHEVPVVNHYGIFLKEILQERFPQLPFKISSYQFQLTYDIDFAFAYRDKGFIRNAAAYWRSLRNFKRKEILFHSKVLLGTRPDPFDTFDYQHALHKKNLLQPVYFFLLADYAAFDKNIPWTKKPFQQLIKKVSDQNPVGIHSSYASNLHPEKVLKEKERLEKITGKNIFRNRQHFLKLTFPSTYQRLLHYGITEDYTMGYASLPGFRAGIASSFSWYDLSKEEATPLRVFPFAVMDASLFYYLKLSPNDALERCKQIIEQVKKAGGTFQFLAHNDLISEQGPWPGWQKKFEELITYASIV
jgi:hypothetical protein